MKFFSNLTMTLFVLITIAAAEKTDGKDVKTVECPNCHSQVNSDGTRVSGAGAKSDESSSSDSGKSKKDNKKGSNTKEDKDKGKSSSKNNGVDFQDTMTILTLVSSLLMTLQ